MAYVFLPKVNTVRKCMDWFLGVSNASANTPRVSSDAGSVVREGVAHNSLPLVTFPWLLEGILLCLLMTFVVSYARSSRQRLPPQPKRLPIIGNFFQLTDKRWLFSRDCKERFGAYRALTLMMLTKGEWDTTRRDHVSRYARKAHNHLQQS
jgi:hypothetical protein